ncbi:MAG TPA: TolC family protein, partial [Oscillatoriaceae cyanobacterium]
MVLAAPARASAPPDLDALVQAADTHNPEIQAARAKFAEAESASTAAGLWAAPSVKSGIMNVAGLAGPSIAISQAIPGGDKLSLAQKAALLDAQAAADEVAATRLDVESKLVAAYYREAAVMRMELIHHEVHARLKELVHVAAAKYSSGQAVRQ